MRPILAVALLALTAGCGGSAPPPTSPRVVDIPIAPLPRPKPAKRAPSAGGAQAVHPNLPSIASSPTLERHDACTGRCAWKSPVPAALAPAASDASPVLLWEESLAAGAEIAIPRDVAVDVLGIVVSGYASVSRASQRPIALDMWQAFRAPDAGVSIKATGGAARVILVAATSGEPLAVRRPDPSRLIP